MFSSRPSNHKPSSSFATNRVGKSNTKSKRSSFREPSRHRPSELDLSSSRLNTTLPPPPAPNSQILTLSIGTSPPRLFAAHTDILLRSPFFVSALRSHHYNPSTRILSLPDEIPEVFSCVLEHLYKGDYTPRLVYDSKRSTWALESSIDANGRPSPKDACVWMPLDLVRGVPSVASSPTLQAIPHPSSNTSSSGPLGIQILKDTAVYCAAEKYMLPQLKKIALRKQGLQTGIPVGTILASARYAYAKTPESDRHLRAHYLALIIRSRDTFKKSGTMQIEMGGASARDASASAGVGAAGGGTGLWFDLFVAMCNHLDDVEAIAKSPR